jgi:hypothetical protein
VIVSTGNGSVFKGAANQMTPVVTQIFVIADTRKGFIGSALKPPGTDVVYI